MATTTSLPLLLRVLLVGLLTVAAPASQADALQRITLVTEAWPGYTNEDGTGLYWEILQEIYESAGITVQWRTTPWKRAQQELMSQQADGLVGEYMTDQQMGYLYPQWHLSIEEPPVALYLSELEEAIKTQQRQALAGKRVSWVRGYQYDQHLLQGIPVDKHLIPRVELGISMVLNRRIDALLDYRSHILPLLADLNAEQLASLRLSEIASGQKLYVVFANNERGRYFRQIFDQGMERLQQQPQRLQAIYAKWNRTFLSSELIPTISSPP